MYLFCYSKIPESSKALKIYPLPHMYVIKDLVPVGYTLRFVYKAEEILLNVHYIHSLQCSCRYKTTSLSSLLLSVPVYGLQIKGHYYTLSFLTHTAKVCFMPYMNVIVEQRGSSASALVNSVRESLMFDSEQCMYM